jgi:hypothetical protein
VIVAGIDEAGLGPLLGPLCVASCAVRLPEGDAAATDMPPDLWHPLRRVVSDKRDRSNHRLHVADSKKVFAGRGDIGLVALRRLVLAWHGVERFADLVNAVAPQGLSPPRWYGDAADDPADALLPMLSNALRHEAERLDISLLPMTGRVLFEPEYNDLCTRLRNKSAVVQGVVAQLLFDLLHQHASTPGGMFIVIDRQGGRSHYGSFLRQMFEDWDLAVDRESDGQSLYTLRRGEAVARLLFAEKSESFSLPTAAASMLAKFLRESFMQRFNAFFAKRDAELKPTAGYWQDALRWMEDAKGAMEQAEVAVTELRRVR